MSQDKYSTWLRLVLYLSVDMPPCAIFSIHTALSNIYIASYLSSIITIKLLLNYHANTKANVYRG